MAGTNKNTNTSTKKRSRCPNGQRKNPKTGKCEPKKVKSSGNNNTKSPKKYKYTVLNKPSIKSRKQKKAMQNELMELSGPYQAHKKEQIVKKALAKKIKANNLQQAKKSLKSRNSKNSINNKPTKKRKRCPNGQRKNKKGECVSKK